MTKLERIRSRLERCTSETHSLRGELDLLRLEVSESVDPEPAREILSKLECARAELLMAWESLNSAENDFESDVREPIRGSGDAPYYKRPASITRAMDGKTVACIHAPTDETNARADRFADFYLPCYELETGCPYGELPCGLLNVAHPVKGDASPEGRFSDDPELHERCGVMGLHETCMPGPVKGFDPGDLRHHIPGFVREREARPEPGKCVACGHTHMGEAEAAAERGEEFFIPCTGDPHGCPWPDLECKLISLDWPAPVKGDG